MKRIALIVLVVVICATSAAFAQSTPAFVRADIPFAFHVNDIKLPSGTYVFQFGAGQFDPILVRGITVNRTSFVPVTANAGQTTTKKLVFRVIGGEYFLSEVHHPVLGSRGLVKGARERQIQFASLRAVEVSGH